MPLKFIVRLAPPTTLRRSARTRSALMVRKVLIDGWSNGRPYSLQEMTSTFTAVFNGAKARIEPDF